MGPETLLFVPYASVWMKRIRIAAVAAGMEWPFIRLDMHLKSGFFAFTCENSATREWMEGPAKKEIVPKHGLGMKVIQQIIKSHGDLLEIEERSDSCRITLAILLDQPFK